MFLFLSLIFSFVEYSMGLAEFAEFRVKELKSIKKTFLFPSYKKKIHRTA